MKDAAYLLVGFMGLKQIPFEPLALALFYGLFLVPFQTLSLFAQS